MDCEACKKEKAQENGISVPFIAHESDMARMERSNKRMWILCIILALLLLGSWAGFLLYESQFEYVSETTQEVLQTADGASSNRFVGGDYNVGNAAS